MKKIEKSLDKICKHENIEKIFQKNSLKCVENFSKKFQKIYKRETNSFKLEKIEKISKKFFKIILNIAVVIEPSKMEDDIEPDSTSDVVTSMDVSPKVPAEEVLSSDIQPVQEPTESENNQIPSENGNKLG